MSSSRIFIRGLPPSLSAEEFREHFSKQYPISDAKIIPHRRIGYIGYKTPEDAARAVKYFNKTFIRLSRIAVEFAVPVTDASLKADGRRSANSINAPSVEKNNNDTANSLKRKRESKPDDPKLKEYLDVMLPGAKRKTWANEAEELGIAKGKPVEPSKDNLITTESQRAADHPTPVAATAPTRNRNERAIHNVASLDEEASGKPLENVAPSEDKADLHTGYEAGDISGKPPVMSDEDWLRSRTSRLLDLEHTEGNDDSHMEISPEKTCNGIKTSSENEGRAASPDATKEGPNADLASINQNGRLFIRNLPYSVTEADLVGAFGPFGSIGEVQIPVDSKTGAAKGFAYIQYLRPDDAMSALQNLDGKIFQGRLVHILPASAKRASRYDQFAVSQMPHKKQQQIQRKAEAATKTFNWNSLYMSVDAVLSSLSDRLGLDKSQIIDPTSSEAAVKQAQAETHLIQETKAYFEAVGVDLDAFKAREKSDNAILVKNFPYGTTAEELKGIFEVYGVVSRVLMPPGGTIAIAKFAEAHHARTAFKALAYRKIKDSILFLERAPKDVFKKGDGKTDETLDSSAKDKNLPPIKSATDLLEAEAVPEDVETATLFVKNLNFSTTTEHLAETFRPLAGFMSARVKMKANPKTPSTPLSMGFGFVEFRSKAQAQAGLKAMNGYNLDGHSLVLKASHKGLDSAQERRQEDRAKKASELRTKIVIKNLPFEATKKDVRALFGAYGQLRSVRVPKKFDSSSRGFAFADFTTPREAENAMNALRHTHFLGRRLVLQFVAEEAQDAEEEIAKMQSKVGSQVNKMALQRLTGSGRKKLNLDEHEEMENA